MLTFVHPNNCNCYECTSPKYKITPNGTKIMVNNMKYHTFGEECNNCGEPKSEYKDLGRKGYYECWYCSKRAAGPLTK